MLLVFHEEFRFIRTNDPYCNNAKCWVPSRIVRWTSARNTVDVLASVQHEKIIMNFPQDLLPGDWLGYYHKLAIMSAAIYLRTGGHATHSAVYAGNGKVVTSLASGVNYYPIDLTGIVMVRRPVGVFDQARADQVFAATIQGKPYGIWDDIKDAFPDVPDKADGINCSHSSALYYWGGGIQCFAPDFDLRTITPRDMETTVALQIVWASFPLGVVSITK